jgi:hypothetical protein
VWTCTHKPAAGGSGGRQRRAVAAEVVAVSANGKMRFEDMGPCLGPGPPTSRLQAQCALPTPRPNATCAHSRGRPDATHKRAPTVDCVYE